MACRRNLKCVIRAFRFSLLIVEKSGFDLEIPDSIKGFQVVRGF